MSRVILCLVFVAVLASIGHGSVIEKRSPGPGVGSDIADYIDSGIKAIGDATDAVVDALDDAKDRVEASKPYVGPDIPGYIADAKDAVSDFFSG